MARIIWSPQSKKDLKIHFARIAKDSLSIARKWQRKIRDAITLLLDFPEVGSPVEEFDDSRYREQIVGNYRILYRFERGSCYIGRIFRGEKEILSEDIHDYFS